MQLGNGGEAGLCGDRTGRPQSGPKLQRGMAAAVSGGGCGVAAAPCGGGRRAIALSRPGRLDSPAALGAARRARMYSKISAALTVIVA
jgi:hypothetical protein